jgi:hypothetical protein
MSGGCSYDLGNFDSKGGAAAHTAAAAPRKVATRVADPIPSELDLVYTRAAVQEVLTRGGKTASQPWENPRSGARGNVTPTTEAQLQGGLLCRGFIASYVRGDQESWLQGEACQLHQGKWDVRSLRPWKRA